MSVSHACSSHFFAYVKTEFERPLLLEQLKDLQTLRLRIVCQHESFAQDAQLMDLCVM